jgi:hypothetical protein
MNVTSFANFILLPCLPAQFLSLAPTSILLCEYIYSEFVFNIEAKFVFNIQAILRYMHALTGGKAAWFDSYLGALETRARDANKPVHAVITDVDADVVNIYGVYLIIQESLTAASEMYCTICLIA